MIIEPYILRFSCSDLESIQNVNEKFRCKIKLFSSLRFGDLHQHPVGGGGEENETKKVGDGEFAGSAKGSGGLHEAG